MRTEEFIEKISKESEYNARFEAFKKGLPLGVDRENGIVLAHNDEKRNVMVRNTCITGSYKTQFIRRLLITLSCIHDEKEACFIVLSPHVEYGELLRLSRVDFTVPYIRNKEDLSLAVRTLRELIYMRESGKAYPHLFLVLDGLETLDGGSKHFDLAEYSAIFEMFLRIPNVDIICGADLAHSIFSDCPDTFLGRGNCLVMAHENGKADVTYVSDSGSLTSPMPITYPNESTVMESIIYLNSLPTNK